MTKSVPSNQLSRREFLKKLTANTAKIAIGAAALSAISEIPQTPASTTTAASPVKQSPRRSVASVRSTAVWDAF